MKVMLDANVLYPTIMREVLLGCAERGLFTPRWSPRILEEWARAAAKYGDAQELIARGEIALVSARFPQAAIVHEPQAERALWLPDPADVHVLAAALAGGCDAIMTLNRADFPQPILREAGVERVEPDPFLRGLLEENADAVRDVVARTLASARELSGEDWTRRRLMKKARLPRLGKALED